MDQSMYESYIRTPDDVRAMIGYAKLDENKLTCITQVIDYSADADSFESYKLLQLDSALLGELSEGNTVVFKGGRSEDAVLCTDSRTFEVKDAETSNSLLLVPSLLWPKESNLNVSLNTSQEDASPTKKCIADGDEEEELPPRSLQNKEVIKVFHNYYELTAIKPKLRRLEQLLQLTRYSGPENEFNIDRSLLFTYDQLLDTIQASRLELQQGLADVKAIEIDDHFRILDFEYEFRIVSYMVALIEENSWRLNEVDRGETIESLKDIVPEFIVTGMFDIYCIDLGNNKHRYKEDLVSRLFAQAILKNAAKFNLCDFLTAWQESVPEGMKTNLSHLSGVALIDRDASPPCIRALDQSRLSETLVDRFRELFKIKSLWTLEQIAPYIECFTTPVIAVSTLLAKYARASTVNGTRYYGAKHS